jgi:hypothetical protein
MPFIRIRTIAYADVVDGSQKPLIFKENSAVPESCVPRNKSEQGNTMPREAVGGFMASAQAALGVSGIVT